MTHMIWYVLCRKQSYIYLKACQWDLGEFDQKGSVGTRWGSMQELTQACQLAKQHGLDILVDAVLNVSLESPL